MARFIIAAKSSRIRSAGIAVVIAGMLALSLFSTAMQATVDEKLLEDANLLTVPLIDQPATIDGSLSEDVWRSAACTTGFVLVGAPDLAEKKTAVLAYYDAERIYFGVECSGDDIKKLAARTADRDGPVWQDDSIEFFLDVDHDRESYFHIAVNSLGVTYDNRCASALPATWSISWNPALSVSAGAGQERWTLELAIPFAELSIGQPKLGDLWGVNICRNSSADEISSWAQVKGSFHRPERFGLFRFGGVKTPVARLTNLGPDHLGKDMTCLEIINPGGKKSDINGRFRLKQHGLDKPADERNISIPAGGKMEMAWPAEVTQPGKYWLDLTASKSAGGDILLHTKLDLTYVPEAAGESSPFVIKLDSLYKDIGDAESAISISFHRPKQELFVDTELIVDLTGPYGEETASRKAGLVAGREFRFEFPLAGLRPGRYEYRVAARDVRDGRIVAEAHKSFCLLPAEDTAVVAKGKLPDFFVGAWGEISPNLSEHGFRGSGFNAIFTTEGPTDGLRIFYNLAGRYCEFIQDGPALSVKSLDNETLTDNLTQAVEASNSSPALGAWFLMYEADLWGAAPDLLERVGRLVKSLDVGHPTALHVESAENLKRFIPAADLFLVTVMGLHARLDATLETIDQVHEVAAGAGKAVGYYFYLWGGRNPAEFRVAAYYALLKGDKGIVFHTGDTAKVYDGETWSIIRGIERETAVLSTILKQSRPVDAVEVIEPSPMPDPKPSLSGTADIYPAGPLLLKSVRAGGQDYLFVLNHQPAPIKFSARMKAKYHSAYVLFDESNVAIDDAILAECIPAYGVRVYRLNLTAGR